MYEARSDPYCYPGTTILKNKADIRGAAALERFEIASTIQRAEEPLPAGRLSVRHYRALHHHLFQDVYRWAGQFRTVRISRAGSMFCYPEPIAPQLNRLFADLAASGFLRGLDANAFAAGGARFLSTLNAIHPFRDGNGRAQLAFLALLAHRAGHPLSLDRLDPSAFLATMVMSFNGSDGPLADKVRKLIHQHRRVR